MTQANANARNRHFYTRALPIATLVLAAQVQQAKTMVAGFSRKLLNVEPEALAALL